MSEVERIIRRELKHGNMTPTELEGRVRAAMKISHGTFITHFKKLRDYEKVLRPTVRPWIEGEKLVIEYELVAEGLGGNIVAGASTFIARFYDITGRYPTAKEVALEFGATPEQTKNTLYETTALTNWRPPIRDGDRKC